MQPGVPIEDCSAHIQHGLDHHRKDKIRTLDQLAHARLVTAAADGPDPTATSAPTSRATPPAVTTAPLPPLPSQAVPVVAPPPSQPATPATPAGVLRRHRTRR